MSRLQIRDDDGGDDDDTDDEDDDEGHGSCGLGILSHIDVIGFATLTSTAMKSRQLGSRQRKSKFNVIYGSSCHGNLASSTL